MAVLPLQKVFLICTQKNNAFCANFSLVSTLTPAIRGGKNDPHAGFCQRFCRKQRNEAVILCDIVADLLAFQKQESKYLYLLPVLRSWFGSNV